MPFIRRLTSAQIAEAMQRAGIPTDTPVLGLFYDHAGGRVEIRMQGKVLEVRPENLPQEPAADPERTTLFPKPLD